MLCSEVPAFELATAYAAASLQSVASPKSEHATPLSPRFRLNMAFRSWRARSVCGLVRLKSPGDVFKQATVASSACRYPVESAIVCSPSLVTRNAVSGGCRVQRITSTVPHGTEKTTQQRTWLPPFEDWQPAICRYCKTQLIRMLDPGHRQITYEQRTLKFLQA